MSIYNKTDKRFREESWLDFRNSGMLFLANQLLHVFGWCLVFEAPKGKSDSEPTRVFAARTKYRGFSEESTERGYKNLSNYMLRAASAIHEETHEE